MGKKILFDIGNGAEFRPKIRVIENPVFIKNICCGYSKEPNSIPVPGISSLESKSGWVPLLVSLMFEYNNPASLWRPYLDLVPDFKELDLPMFWSR